jgi:hypothetical protein
MNWKVFRIGALVAVVAAGLTLWAGSDAETFALFVYGRLSLVFVLPPLVLAVLFLAIDRAWRAPGSRGHGVAISVLLAVALFFALLTPASWAGESIANWRHERAKAGIDTTVAALDQFKAAFGRYPESLAEAQEAGFRVPVPDMALRSNFYHPSPSRQKFGLVLLSPKPCTDTFYNSASGEWSDCKEGHGGQLAAGQD